MTAVPRTKTKPRLPVIIQRVKVISSAIVRRSLCLTAPYPRYIGAMNVFKECARIVFEGRTEWKYFWMPTGVYVFSPRCQEAVRLLGTFLFISGKRFRRRATVDRTLARLSPPKWTRSRYYHRSVLMILAWIYDYYEISLLGQYVSLYRFPYNETLEEEEISFKCQVNGPLFHSRPVSVFKVTYLLTSQLIACLFNCCSKQTRNFLGARCSRFYLCSLTNH